MSKEELVEKEKNELDDFMSDYYNIVADEDEKIKEKYKNLAKDPNEDWTDGSKVELQNEKGDYLLSGILILCGNVCYRGRQEDYDKLNEVKNKLVIRSYLPLEEKTKLITPIIIQAQAVIDNLVITEMNIEIGKIIFGLIDGYCINIVNDLSLSALQMDIIDLLYKTEFIDYILTYCHTDYERFEKMVDNTLNFSHLMQMLDAFSTIDPNYIDALNKELESLHTKLTPDAILAIKEMAKVGTPAFDEMINDINDLAVKKTLDKKEDKK